jgi:hypothetical protein
VAVAAVHLQPVFQSLDPIYQPGDCFGHPLKQQNDRRLALMIGGADFGFCGDEYFLLVHPHYFALFSSEVIESVDSFPI